MTTKLDLDEAEKLSREVERVSESSWVDSALHRRYLKFVTTFVPLAAARIRELQRIAADERDLGNQIAIVARERDEENYELRARITALEAQAKEDEAAPDFVESCATVETPTAVLMAVRSRLAARKREGGEK